MKFIDVIERGPDCGPNGFRLESLPVHQNGRGYLWGGQSSAEYCAQCLCKRMEEDNAYLGYSYSWVYRDDKCVEVES